MKTILVVVEGGLGKHLLFTALTKKLKEKYEKVVVSSAYYDVMKACPYIDDAVPFGQTDLSELVYQKNCSIVSGNPYSNERFIKKEIHLLEAWSELLGISYDKKTKYRPFVNAEKVSSDFKKESDAVIKKLGKYIIVQFYGGQSPMTNGQGNYVEVLKRNYYKGEVVVKELKKKYPEHKILNFSLPNEPAIKDTEKIEVPYLYYLEIAKQAEKIVCIDSSLQHIAAAAEKSAIVLWGETRPEHFGWDLHKNIVVDEQKGSPYFVALGPSPQYIDFPRPSEVMNLIESD